MTTEEYIEEDSVDDNEGQQEGEEEREDGRLTADNDDGDENEHHHERLTKAPKKEPPPKFTVTSYTVQPQLTATDAFRDSICFLDDHHAGSHQQRHSTPMLASSSNAKSFNNNVKVPFPEFGVDLVLSKTATSLSTATSKSESTL